MKLLIVNQPLGNRGDESAHKALVKSINERFPETKIKVLFINGNTDSIEQFKVHNPNNEYVNYKNVLGSLKILRWATMTKIGILWKIHPTTKQIIEEIKGYDYIICAPGGICMGGFQNWNHISILHMTKYLKKSIIYYGRSFGPFPTKTIKNRLFKKRSIELLHYFSFLSIRDTITENLANELKIDYVPTLDSAFLYQPKIEIDTSIKELIGNSYTIFVPNSLRWHYKYSNISEETIFSFFSNVIKLIHKHSPNDKIVLLPQTFNSNVGEHELFSRLAQTYTYVIALSNRISSDMQQAIISNAHAVIGTRYHSVVFAINQNVPFIALSYEHKIEGLLNRLNKLNCMVNIENIFTSPTSTNSCLKAIDSLLPQITNDKAAQLEAKQIALCCFNKMSELLQPNQTIK